VGLGSIARAEILSKGLRALNQPVAVSSPVGKAMLYDFQASGEKNADGFQYIDGTQEETAYGKRKGTNVVMSASNISEPQCHSFWLWSLSTKISDEPS
jgi:hypothetical protein